MKNVYKKAIIAMIIIIVLILAYIQYGHLIFDQTHLIDQEAEHSMNGVTTIKIANVSTDIIIHTAAHDYFYATYQGSIKATTPKAVPLLTAEQEDSTLNIDINYSDYQILSMKNMSFNIYLPSDYQFNLEILSDSGNIKVSPMKLNRLVCVTSSGNIVIKSSVLTSLVTSSITGNIDATLDSDILYPVSAHTTNGTLISDFPIIDYTHYKLLTTSGNITVTKD